MLFSDPFREFDALTENFFAGRRASLKPIPMDAWKDSDNLHIQFEIPGVREDQINLEMDRGVLTLTIDRPMEEIDGERLISERSYGMYRRQLSLGRGLDLDNVNAVIEAGLLKLTIPVAEQAKPRQIAIGNSESSVSELKAKEQETSSA